MNAEVSADAAHTGWEARLTLRMSVAGQRTVLAERAHHGPLVVQRPFWPEGPVCHLYLVHPPGGVAGGDRLHLQLQADPGSQSVITTPAATKIYRAFGARTAVVEQHLAANDATLEWLPQETIVFSGARARLRTRVELSGRARFIGWEILCLGRPASGESFAAGTAHQNFELWHEQRPLLLDRLRLAGGDPALQARWGLDGLPVLGTLLAWPATAEHLQIAREASADAATAATLVDAVLLIRLRSHGGEAVRQEFERIWRALRPAFAGLAAHAPRIWAT